MDEENQRSTDYGSTYERMNDKVGSKTVLSYLYVCPSNKRKIMVLTDPEFESSVFISSDEGASYQKYRLSFYILSLLFHPTQEDWALAYSHDQKKMSALLACKPHTVTMQSYTPVLSSVTFTVQWSHVEESSVPPIHTQVTSHITSCEEDLLLWPMSLTWLP
eukprot:XP_014029984.1 PREDICTED: VPS10 domain-containing receptor SorCS1-like isoform X1 [Salmo salar]